ncbi:uncharacterized protein [Bemisia tabaci]|uniref:uncharacterized protein isoform X4 n=1 Tax=Bemisia tabaci TaxID=7038 RepID=UPI003B28A22A
MDEGAASLSSSLFSSAQFNQAVFHNLVDCYPGGSNLECTYSLHGEIQHSEKDQVGVFQVGWQSISDAHLLKPAPKPSEPIWFNGHLLPKDGKMYQLCYVTEQGMIAGASVPFFFQSPDDSEWVAVENSDDDFVTVERNFSAMQTNNARLTLENQQLKDELIRTRNKLTRLVHLEQPKDDILEAEGASSVSNEAVKANPSSQEDSRRTLDETTKDSQNNQAALNSLPLTDKANWFCNGGEHHVGLSCNLSWLKNFMVEEYNIPEEEVSVMIDSFCQEFERLRRKLNSKEQKPLEKDEKEDTNVTEQAIWPLNTRNFPSSSTYLSLIRNFMVEEYGMPEQDVLPMINSFYREIETLRRKFNSKEQAPLEKEGTNEESHAEEATMAEASGSSSTSTSTDDVQEVSETIKQPTTSGSEVKCDAQGFKCGDDNSNPSPPMGESSNTAPRTVRRPWLHIARKYNGPRPFVFGRTSMEQMMDGWHPNPILAGRRRLMQTEKIQALEAEIAGLQSYIQELESTKQPSSAERGDHLDDIVLVLSDELAKVELENKKLKETVDRFMAGSTERLEAHSTEQRGTSVADDMEQRGSVTNRESLVNKATQSEEEGVPETFKHAAQNYVGNCNLGWRNRSLIGCLNDVRTPLHAVLSQPVVPGTRFEFQVRTLPHCKNFTIKLGYDQSRFPLQATISTDMIDLSCQGSSLYGEKHDLPQDLRPDTCYALIFVVNSDSIEITIQSHSGATLYWNEYRPSVPVTEIQYVHVDGNVVVCDATLKEADNACCLEMRERLRRAFVEYVDLSYRYSLLKSKLESAQKKDL